MTGSSSELPWARYRFVKDVAPLDPSHGIRDPALPTADPRNRPGRARVARRGVGKLGKRLDR